MKILFSHSRPRKYQEDFIQDVWTSISKGRHLLAHAPTGIGKTAAVLGPALTWALENDGTVFFLTPKISQHEIAVNELLRIAKRHKVKFRAADIIGRRYACVDKNLEQLDVDEFYEVCNKRRKNENCPYYAWARGFTPAQREQAKLHLEKLLSGYGIVTPAHRLVEMCKSFEYGGEKKPLCAYEVMTQIARDSQVIIADYFHLLSPGIRESFLIKTKKSLNDSVIIIDEAHNVPSRVRSHLSVSITHLLVRKAEKEIKLMGARHLEKHLRRLSKSMDEILAKKLNDQKETLLSKSDVPIWDEDTISEFHDVGVSYLEAANRTKSACIKLSKFFSLWSEELPSYIRMAKKWRSGAGVTVSYKNLDPSLATQDLIDSAHSVIAMSGTLIPLEMYRDLLGFDQERTNMKIYRSPFPKKNRLNVVYTGVTTRYSHRTDEEFRKIGKIVSDLLDVIPGNVAVFFPSYDVLRNTRDYIKTNREVLVQRESSRPEETNELIALFKRMKDKGAVLLAVAGGSLSEGIDYPGKELVGVIVVGIPLNEYDLETKALIDYYEYKFGAGWTYGYLYPAMSRAIQAAGRLIRNEDDTGVVVFMDERYKWKNYRRVFPPDLDIYITENPVYAVKEFFSRL